VIASLLEGVNWEVVAIYAALVLLEGLRRVPAGALVVRGIGPTGWKPVGDPEPRSRWRLVSWWSPASPAVVLPSVEGPFTVGAAEIQARLEVARRAARWLTGAAALTVAGLTLGLPVVSTRFGGVGFLAGAAVVLLLAVTNAWIGVVALRRLGAPAQRTQVLAWCSPFAAGRVLEGVYEAALAGASQAQAVRALAGEEVFAAWSRSRAYDVLHREGDDPDLRAAADDGTLRAIVAQPPSTESGASFCPRCAATWRMSGGACPACAVPLTSPSAW